MTKDNLLLLTKSNHHFIEELKFGKLHTKGLAILESIKEDKVKK